MGIGSGLALEEEKRRWFVQGDGTAANPIQVGAVSLEAMECEMLLFCGGIAIPPPEFGATEVGTGRKGCRSGLFE